jgi:uncharacterized protein
MAGKTIRVLSLDGGGIRGLMSARILAELEALTGQPICRLFDFVAGTSTGGILALALTVPDGSGAPRYRAADLGRIYLEHGREIFSRSLWHRVSALDNLLDERYPSKGIEGVLQTYFGDARLKDTLLPVLITAYEIERRAPFLFRTRYARTPPRAGEVFDFPLWQVARATSAAPTYFEPCKIAGAGKDYYALVDGGVYANNPAMCAFAEMRAQHPQADVLLVSIGTGELCRRIPFEEAKDWGIKGWMRPVLDVVFDGVSDTVDFQLRALLPRSYYRFQTRLDEGSDDMDDASRTNLRVLGLLADRLVAESHDRLATLASRLTAAPEG